MPSFASIRPAVLLAAALAVGISGCTTTGSGANLAGALASGAALIAAGESSDAASVANAVASAVQGGQGAATPAGTPASRSVVQASGTAPKPPTGDPKSGLAPGAERLGVGQTYEQVMEFLAACPWTPREPTFKRWPEPSPVNVPAEGVQILTHMKFSRCSGKVDEELVRGMYCKGTDCDFYRLDSAVAKAAELPVGRSMEWQGLKSFGTITVMDAYDIGRAPCKRMKVAITNPGNTHFPGGYREGVALACRENGRWHAMEI